MPLKLCHFYVTWTFYVKSQGTLKIIPTNIIMSIYIELLPERPDRLLLRLVSRLGIYFKSRPNVGMTHDVLHRLKVVLPLAEPRAERVPHMVT